MAKKKMEPLIVSSKAKAILKKAGCNTAGDGLDGLNGWVYWLLEHILPVRMLARQLGRGCRDTDLLLVFEAKQGSNLARPLPRMDHMTLVTQSKSENGKDRKLSCFSHIRNGKQV